MEKARNDLSAAVPKFCLALEEHRRTPDGRVRTSQELLATFFSHDEKGCTDRILKYLPNEVRGPIVAAWGVRGIKAALRDNDEKAQSVLYDALLAGDVDHTAFEEGLTAETLVRWVPLGDLWAFWRGGKLTKQAIHKALSTAYELFLFDARWFLETVTAKGGSLKGTDVLADGLSKDDLTQWVRRIHETGDGSPKGVVAALGWDKIVAKTQNDVLVAVLDAVAVKVGLVAPSPKDAKLPEGNTRQEGKTEPAVASAEPPPAAQTKWSLSFALAAAAKPVSTTESGLGKPEEAKQPQDNPAAAAIAEDAGSSADTSSPRDAGMTDEASSWSDEPPPPSEDGDSAVVSAAEDIITVVLDDEGSLSSSSPGEGSSLLAPSDKTGGSARSGPPPLPPLPNEDEEEMTVVKSLHVTDQPPPQRGPTSRR